MTIIICPNCNRRRIVEGDTSDFICECNSGVKAIDERDILRIGNWEDYTGSGDVSNALMQGAENKLWGTRAQLEGEDLDPLTARGKSASTHRVRQHLEFIELKGRNN